MILVGRDFDWASNYIFADMQLQFINEGIHGGLPD